MPAGITKTPNSGRGAGAAAKDANSGKKSGSADAKGSTTSNSGKKLVQTRLPFKLITPGTAKAGEAGASSTSSPSLVVVDADVMEPRKRKLSYSEGKDDEVIAGDSLNATEDALLRRSNSKENLALGATATKKVKTTDMDVEAETMAEDVIALDDDENSDLESDINVPKQKEVGPTPIQIKLPLKNKRSKRRKSLKKSEEKYQTAVAKKTPVKVALNTDSSDDIEELAEELNPQKKQKVSETDKAEKPKTRKGKKTNEEPVKSMDLKNDSKKEPSNKKDRAKKEVVAVTSKKQYTENSKPKEETSKSVASKEENDKKVQPELGIREISSSDSESNNQPNRQSSTDHDMDVDDTDTVNKISSEKEKPHRKSISRAASASSTPTAESSDAKKSENLTPKQQRLLEQRRKAREEKELKLQEERRIKQQEKEQREQQRKLERDQKEEQRRKERDQKDEQRRTEREERERKRQAEMDSKNEEKRKRNEAKEEIQRKKDEERRRKEQEKEEAEQKKKRAAESFTKFFVQKQIPNADSSNNCLEHDPNSCDSNGQQSGGPSSQQSLAFRPFQVKDDMVMAPVTRNLLNSPQRNQLDQLFRRNDDEDAEEDTIGRSKRPSKAQLYLSELNLGKHKPLKTQRDARLQRRTKDEEEYNDVQIIDEMDEGPGIIPIVEDQSKQLPRMRAKYLHFADNRRPPYYGTWRKSTKVITARRPLGQDKLHFDYDLDSDCEWEEEEPGESLSASEDEKERESEEESEEEYNEWYVPHGHLSDEELQNDGEIDDGNTREAQKAKLQVLQQEFAQEMKKQTKKIKPRLLGPIWLDENGKISELYPAYFAQTIDMYGCWQLEPLSLEPPSEPQREEEPTNTTTILQLDTPRIQQLIRLIHGNRNAKAFLISEFLEYLKGTQDGNTSLIQLPSKSILREKIDELASWQPVELTNSSDTPAGNGGNAMPSAKKQKKPKKRLCWVVPEEILGKYDLKALTLQNEWIYALTPKVKKGDISLRDVSLVDEQTVPEKTVESSSPKTAPTTTTTTAGSNKKRAPLLMSVPRDQPIHGPTKNALISRYLRRESDAKESKGDESNRQRGNVIILSD